MLSKFDSAPVFAGTSADYRALPRVSNSDLTRLKEEHLGYGSLPSARFSSEKAKAFGRAFHQHLLEPETIGDVMGELLPDMAPKETQQLTSLMDTIYNDSFCKRYLQQAQKRRPHMGEALREHVVLFTDPVSQVECKARLDLVYTSPKRQNALVLDFKTTSARTQAQFLESCYTYDYDRQAAFYLDSLRHADAGVRSWVDTRRFRFIFVGVMKQRPYRLFAVEATSIPGFIEYGRKKYRFWLRKWQEEQESPLYQPERPAILANAYS
nr:PD-(D/E)XK nuclease-like domain-containing protein [uncultured Arsenicibacter sp.]